MPQTSSIALPLSCELQTLTIFDNRRDAQGAGADYINEVCEDERFRSGAGQPRHLYH